MNIISIIKRKEKKFYFFRKKGITVLGCKLQSAGNVIHENILDELIMDFIIVQVFRATGLEDHVRVLVIRVWILPSRWSKHRTVDSGLRVGLYWRGSKVLPVKICKKYFINKISRKLS